MVYLNQVLQELSDLSIDYPEMDSFLEKADQLIEDYALTEAEYNKVVAHLRFKVLNIEQYVKDNNMEQVTNPRAFVRNSIPSDDGLLSNKIFGISMEERAGTYAYIDLHDWFLDPSCFKTWIRLDPKIRNCIHGIGTYMLDKNGYVIEAEDGETGIPFLKKNIKDIKFRASDSAKKKLSIDFLNFNRDLIFIKKYLVIPPFYRDKNTEDSRVVGLGGVNKLYTNLIIAANAIQTTQDYMFDASDAMKGRVQEAILNLYDWFCGNQNPAIEGSMGSGLSGKLGIMRRTNLAKTTDFSARLVMSAPELKAERPEQMMVDFDHAAIPLYSLMTNYRDFIMFQVMQFFGNEFRGRETYPVIDADGSLKHVVVKDPEITFSDDRIKEEMERYLHGYTNRFVPIEIPVEGTKRPYYMRYIGMAEEASEMQLNDDGTYTSKVNPESVVNRRMLWLDIFYMAAVEAVKNKKCLITRFPVSEYLSQPAIPVMR